MASKKREDNMHLKSTKVATIITIGTEITDGQILNTNSQWLSNELNNLGFNIETHISIQDNEKQINKALNYATSCSNYIFISGGLGPTSDDITRFAVSNFTSKKTFFDETSWSEIQARFKERKSKLSETNKRQCIFPVGAEIIANPAGTANAFKLEHDHSTLYVLPGPPSEIKAIWNNSLKEELTSNSEASMELLTWKLMGVSESILAEEVEDKLKNSSLIFGYRPHFPYIELKVWYEKSLKQEVEKDITLLKNSVKEWMICEGKYNPYQEFSTLLKKNRTAIIDNISHGQFAKSLRPYIANKELSIVGELSSLSLKDIEADLIQLHTAKENTAYILSFNGKEFKINIPSKYKKLSQSARDQYISEISILKLVGLL